MAGAQYGLHEIQPAVYGAHLVSSRITPIEPWRCRGPLVRVYGFGYDQGNLVDDGKGA
jgi:hypothetical protein